eukprot:m.70039 g.70039  ORF g.70039 m.70039 type:complete len:73 (+) comp35655_c0_seq4:445-663(+)
MQESVIIAKTTLQESQLELVLLVLGRLAEDVTSDPHLPQKRKTELTRSLQFELKPLLAFLQYTLGSLLVTCN